MKTLGEVFQLSSRFLSDRKIENHRRLAEDLLSALLECKRIELYMQFDKPLDECELEIFRKWIKRAASHEPFEYIVGETDFFGAKIKIDSRVLIPRPETEIMADLISKRIEKKTSLWDLCTGSGCIGISLKKRFPRLEVALSDLSEEAISLARENAKKNGVDVECLIGNFLSPFAGRKADCIVCNPPYVSAEEYLQLDPSVRSFEPKMALVAEDEGFAFYERLAKEAPQYLKDGGSLFLEIGWMQGERVKKIFEGPLWKKGELLQDLSGKDRFFFLEKQ